MISKQQYDQELRQERNSILEFVISQALQHKGIEHLLDIASSFRLLFIVMTYLCSVFLTTIPQNNYKVIMTLAVCLFVFRINRWSKKHAILYEKYKRLEYDIVQEGEFASTETQISHWKSQISELEGVKPLKIK